VDGSGVVVTVAVPLGRPADQRLTGPTAEPVEARAHQVAVAVRGRSDRDTPSEARADRR
jgi:hypothetical protein